MDVTVRRKNARFDSKIEIPNTTGGNCIIALELRILMTQQNGRSFTSRRGEVYRTKNWEDGEWNQFRFLFKHITTHWWSHQFWFRPPTTFNEMNLPLGHPTHRPNFRCILRIQLVNSAADNPHARIRVVRLADSERAMRSNTRTFDNRDIQSSHGSGGFPHITAVHEVGHLLGMDHPGIRENVPACMVDGNADVCYEPNNELMAGGLDFVPAYAEPWRDRLAWHTDTDGDDWTLLREESSPTRLSLERLNKDIIDGSQQRMRDRVIKSVEGL